MRTRSNRALHFENLEGRQLLSAAPLGAIPNDTAEFMLGRVLVTPVFLESDGTLDTSTEDWTASEVDQMLRKVRDSVQWWTDTLDGLDSVHELEFVIDETYARTPHPTKYEPIRRPSTDYTLWVGEFLEDVGQPQGLSLEQGIRNFNHEQREEHKTDWAFTMFIVDSSNDIDGQFAAGGPNSFRTAFAFPGGLFLISPSTRPTSTLTHETGHIFYAVDEYQDGAGYSVTRGYYNTQNLNGYGYAPRPGNPGDLNPDPNFVQEPTIMSGGITLQTAFLQNTSAASTLAFVGWQDSDGDGVFDVLDVPLELAGTGQFDGTTNTYRFNGTASAKALPNQNPAGLRNDITLNEISRIEYRIDGGQWQIAAEPKTQVAELSLTIPMEPSRFGLIEIRAKDTRTGVTSNIYQATPDVPTTTDSTGAQGYVWLDLNEDSVFDEQDRTLPDATARLVDASGQAVSLAKTVEPDELASGVISGIDGVTLSTVGISLNTNVAALDSNFASTGSKAFFAFDAGSFLISDSWSSARNQNFRADFEQPTSRVSIDATGLLPESYGRLEAYDSAGQMITRVTSDAVAVGESTTLTVETTGVEIAFVLAFGHANTSVSLDNLRFGPEEIATSGSNGVFSFPGLPDGQYYLAVETAKPQIHQVSGDPIPVQVIGSAASPVSVRVVPVASPWQNPVMPSDVDDSGDVAPLDALRIVNELSRNGSYQLSGTRNGSPYYDVNGDGVISPVDALTVLNELNRAAASGESLSTTKPANSPATQIDSVFSSLDSVDSLIDATGEAEFLSIPLPSTSLQNYRYSREYQDWFLQNLCSSQFLI